MASYTTNCFFTSSFSTSSSKNNKESTSKIFARASKNFYARVNWPLLEQNFFFF
jgi:hypothetical protein